MHNNEFFKNKLYEKNNYQMEWNGMRWNNQKGGWMDTHRTNYDSSWWNLKYLCANQMIKF